MQLHLQADEDGGRSEAAGLQEDTVPPEQYLLHIVCLP